jgi:hypothetical protein
VLSDGFTAIERTMMEGGEPERVLEMRRDGRWSVARLRLSAFLRSSADGSVRVFRDVPGWLSPAAC